MYIWVENVTALLTQRTGFHQLQNFNRETQQMLLFAEVQVTRTTLLKLARINISSKFNSKFNIPFCRAMEYFPRTDISIAYFHILFSVATACVTAGHHHDDVFVLSYFHFPCLTSPIVTLPGAQSKQEMSGLWPHTDQWTMETGRLT